MAYWLDGLLREVSRAVGGEDCVVCGGPVPAGAPWIYRDRWVCSYECNIKKKRRLKARIKRGEIQVAEPVEPEVIVPTARLPRHFATTLDVDDPYEHDFSPMVGDSFERHGEVTSYVGFADFPWHSPYLDELYSTYEYEPDPHRMAAIVHEGTGAWRLAYRGESGAVDRMPYPRFLAPSAGAEFVVDARSWDGQTPLFADEQLYFGWEMVSDVADTGGDYRWEAWLFSGRPIRGYWTPARHALSKRRRRVTASRTSYQARMRARGVQNAAADAIDPIDVFVRDDWRCQICREAIDPSLGYPDPMSASLDHVIAVAVGGGHTSENVRASHLRCNIARGDR